MPTYIFKNTKTEEVFEEFDEQHNAELFAKDIASCVSSTLSLHRLAPGLGFEQRLEQGGLLLSALRDLHGAFVGAPLVAREQGSDAAALACEAIETAKQQGTDIVPIDTAGRLQIDEPLVQELVRLRDLVKPQEILLVLDAATGQEASVFMS